MLKSTQNATCFHFRPGCQHLSQWSCHKPPCFFPCPQVYFPTAAREFLWHLPPLLKNFTRFQLLRGKSSYHSLKVLTGSAAVAFLSSLSIPFPLTHSVPATWVFSLVLSHAQYAPTSGPLQMLYPLPGTPSTRFLPSSFLHLFRSFTIPDTY